jgi:ribosome-associated protein
MTIDTDDREDPERPSKSQRKRDMAALQEIGTELVMLNAGQLAQIELPERLFDAIIDAQRIRDFEGRRRQMQYIGKLMREIDAAPIRAKLDMWSGAARASTAQQRLIERWRERLLADDAELTAFAAEYASCDLQHLRSLIASVKRDLSLKRTPKNYRALFRTVREIVAAEPRRGES